MWVAKKLILVAGFLTCAYWLLNQPEFNMNFEFNQVKLKHWLVTRISTTLFITAAAYVLAGFLDRKRPRVIDAEPVAGELVRR